MKIDIDQIKVDKEERIRKDVGDLKPLEDSISKVGLINPILIDEQNNLVAGYRRFTACTNLGFTEIDVTVVEINGDMMKMLDVEVAENFFRKDFTPEEILSTEERRRAIIEAAREKGFFEKKWLWLKSLFAPASVVENSRPTYNQNDLPVEPTSHMETSEPKETAVDISEKAEDQTETEEKIEPVAPPVRKSQPKDDDHNIKWRST